MDDELFQFLGGRVELISWTVKFSDTGNMGAVSFRSWTLWNVERSTAQPASGEGPRLGPVGTAAEQGRSGTENPREDGCTSGAAGFLHDVLDALFDRSAALTSAHSSLTAIGSTSAAAF